MSKVKIVQIALTSSSDMVNGADTSDYLRLCKHCHAVYDKAIGKLDKEYFK